MRNLLIIPLFFIIISCNTNNDNDIILNDFKGYYKVTSINSETEIDLNNDGIKSFNILEEISSPHTTLNGIFSNFYNAENPRRYAEVRPTIYQSKTADTQFISFNFPEQTISYLNNDLILNIPLLMDYSTSMGPGIYYEFVNQNEIKIIDRYREWNSQFGEIKNLTRIDKTTFQINLDKIMFDFSSKQWKVLKLNATYKKV